MYMSPNYHSAWHVSDTSKTVFGSHRTGSTRKQTILSKWLSLERENLNFSATVDSKDTIMSVKSDNKHEKSSGITVAASCLAVVASVVWNIVTNS